MDAGSIADQTVRATEGIDDYLGVDNSGKASFSSSGAVLPGEQLAVPVPVPAPVPLPKVILEPKQHARKSKSNSKATSCDFQVRL